MEPHLEAARRLRRHRPSNVGAAEGKQRALRQDEPDCSVLSPEDPSHALGGSDVRVPQLQRLAHRHRPHQRQETVREPAEGFRMAAGQSLRQTAGRLKESAAQGRPGLRAGPRR